MHTTFLAGGIASGKSTVARMLHERGAWLCDLDQVSRDVLESGGPVLAQIASEFGDDLIDPETGELDRLGLAVRAFASPEATERLEAIEMPAIRERMSQILTNTCCAATEPALTVVEVPLLDRVEDLLPSLTTCSSSRRRSSCAVRAPWGAAWTPRTSTPALPARPATSTCVPTPLT